MWQSIQWPTTNNEGFLSSGNWKKAWKQMGQVLYQLLSPPSEKSSSDTSHKYKHLDNGMVKEFIGNSQNLSFSPFKHTIPLLQSHPCRGMMLLSASQQHLALLPSTRGTWRHWRESGEGPQQWDLSIPPVRKGWENCLAQRRKDSGGISWLYRNTWRKGAERMEAGSFQWCPVRGQKALGTNSTTGGYTRTSESPPL